MIKIFRAPPNADRDCPTFHSLRHSFKPAMANVGVTQEIRRRHPGHAAKAINDHDTYPELETVRHAVDAVPAMAGL